MPEAVPIFNVASTGERQEKQAACPIAFFSRRAFRKLVLVRESAAKHQWLEGKLWYSLHEQEN